MEQLINSELDYWRKKKRESTGEESVKIDGAIAELLHYEPENVNRDYLAKRYKRKLKRSKTPRLKNRALDLIARNRAVKACESIARLGRKVSELDKTKEGQ